MRIPAPKIGKQYLGDSVYAEVENGMLKLTTENGCGATNTIFLENEVYASLTEFVRALQPRCEHCGSPDPCEYDEADV